MEITTKSGNGVECKRGRVGLREKNNFNKGNARRIEGERERAKKKERVKKRRTGKMR